MRVINVDKTLLMRDALWDFIRTRCPNALAYDFNDTFAMRNEVHLYVMKRYGLKQTPEFLNDKEQEVFARVIAALRLLDGMETLATVEPIEVGV